MRLENNGGDVLARGGVRATFKPAGSHLTDKAWDDIWGDFDAEKFRNSPTPTDPNARKATASGAYAETEDGQNGQSGGNASVEAGTVGLVPGEVVPSA